MSKAILILEKHEHCINCPLLDGEYDTCVVTGGYVERMIRKEDKREIPCPLKPMPKKKNPLDDGGMFLGKGIEGYNACIDEILGEENDKD